MKPLASAGAEEAGWYTTREVSGLCGLSEAQVRQYVRRGVLDSARRDGGRYRFSFQDVVLLRTARGLLDADVSVRRTIAALLKLKRGLEAGGSLASMRIFVDGDEVVVREASALWDIDSGQGRLDFDVGEVASEVATLAEKRRFFEGEDFEDLGSDEWYNFGLDLEEMDPERAPDAYERAIALDPKNADAHVNLGRLCQLKGDLKSAKRHYQLALEAASDHQLASYNMGTVFDELDEVETASEHYRRAPDVPDAHYNLARIFELNGDEVSSLRHLRKYRQLLDRTEG